MFKYALHLTPVHDELWKAIDRLEDEAVRLPISTKNEQTRGRMRALWTWTSPRKQRQILESNLQWLLQDRIAEETKDPTADESWIAHQDLNTMRSLLDIE